jgi:aromatic-L-amino-acid decarboxylase
MTPEEFKQWGYRFIDWTAEYLAHPENQNVLSQVRPGDIRKQLPAEPPAQPESFDAVLRDLDRVILPGLTHWNNPSFFAYFPNTGSEPGIFGEMVTAALNVNGMLWRTSPAATELEEHVLGWLRSMLGLPETFKGMTFDTASSSTFHGLAAARETVTERSIREDGLSGPGAPRLRMYASEQAHSSIEKSAMALGIGRRGLVKIPTDAEFRMDPKALDAAIEKDLREGYRPFAVVATVGTTSTTSIDPVASIADICEKRGLWLHVDAAYAGSAAILPEMRYILEGCERADSFVTNPHKWLMTPMDLSAFFCRRPEMLRKAFTLTPDYLMVVRHYGVEGLQASIREHIRLGKLFASLVAEDARFEVVAPVPFSTVCFRLKTGDADNQALMDRVNASGKLFISHTRLNDKLTIRFAIGNARSSEAHVRAAWEEISRR